VLLHPWLAVLSGGTLLTGTTHGSWKLVEGREGQGKDHKERQGKGFEHPSPSHMPTPKG